MLTIIIQMMKIIFGGGFKSGGAKENALSFKTLFWLINWKNLFSPKRVRTSHYTTKDQKRDSFQQKISIWENNHQKVSFQFSFNGNRVVTPVIQMQHTVYYIQFLHDIQWFLNMRSIFHLCNQWREVHTGLGSLLRHPILYLTM